MKKKYLSIFLFVFLVLSIGCLLFFFRRQKVDDRIDPYIPETILFPSHIQFSVMTDGKEIDNGLFIRYLFNNHLFDEPILVVDYSQMGCKSCIDFMLNGLADEFGNPEQNSKLLFVVSDSYRDDNESIVGNTIFLPKEEILGFEPERSRYPLLFVYAHGVRHSFVPDPDTPEILKLYLKTVRIRYGF